MGRVRCVAWAVFVGGLAGCEVRSHAGTGPGSAAQPPTALSPRSEQETVAAGPKEGPAGSTRPAPPPAPKEDPAEAALKRIGGYPTRDKKQPGEPVVAVRLWTDKADKVTDDDLKVLAQFPKLRRVELSAPGVTGTGFAALAELPLEELDLSFAKDLNDEGLKAIGKLTALKVLLLPQGKHTDEGMKHLSGLVNLEELSVSYGVNDVGMYVTKNMKQLRKVSATNCGVGDGAMKVLSGLPEMRELKLYGSAVTDLGYSYIGKMDKLEELQTSYGISDAGVAELGKLKNLRKLSVWNSRVTIKAIRALPNLKNLKDLDIGTWNIKAEEAAALRDELPECNVRHNK